MRSGIGGRSRPGRLDELVRRDEWARCNGTGGLSVMRSSVE